MFSSIERDGMLSGPDLEAAARVARPFVGRSCTPAESATLDDLRALAALRQVNMSGVIVGKALYEGRFDVARRRPVDGGA